MNSNSSLFRNGIAVVSAFSLAFACSLSNAEARTRTTKAKKAKAAKVDPVLQETGVFTGSPEATHEIVVSRWGFPNWWPTIPGRVTSVSTGFSSDFEPPNGPIRRQFNMELLVAPPFSAKELADKVSLPVEFVRTTVATGPDDSDEGVRTDSVEFLAKFAGRDSRMSVSVSKDPVINGKLLARIVFSEPIESGADFRVPTPTLLKLVPVPVGVTTTGSQLIAYDHNLLQKADGSVIYKYARPQVSFDVRFKGASGDPASAMRSLLLPGYSMGIVQPGTDTVTASGGSTGIVLSFDKDGSGYANANRSLLVDLFPK
jgi:hypothetical protein